MTSSTTTGTGQQTIEGRSVRDIVEHEHGQVTEAWCRRIFRKLLQSLELQYAMEMPHRAITADTVVFHDNGEPLLLPSIISDPEPEQAGDLTALARLIHYAITQELIPTGPLHGRGLADFSESLLTAVDRCMDSDPAARPQTIEALRNLLGMVAPGAVAAAAPMVDPVAAPDAVSEPAAVDPVAVPEAIPEPAAVDPVPVPEAVPEPAAASTAPPAPGPQPLRAAAAATAASAAAAAHAAAAASAAAAAPVAAAKPAKANTATPAPATMNSAQRGPHPGNRRRWAMAATAAILLAVLLGAYALRDPAPATPPLVQGATGSPPAQGAAPADAAPPSVQAGAGAPAGVPPGASVAQDPAAAPSPAAPAAPVAPAAPGEATSTQAIPEGGATYSLQIQPWGTVYVDGVDRGVSPPIKRLVLAPGRHAIRVTNPNFPERLLDVDTANGDGRIAVDFSETE
jgi:hypothetical protein